MQVLDLERIGEARELHHCAATGKAGKGELVAVLKEEFRVRRSRRLIRILAVQADHRTVGHQFQQWSRRAVEYECAHTVGQCINMRFAHGAEILAQVVLSLECHAWRHPVCDGVAGTPWVVTLKSSDA